MAASCTWLRHASNSPDSLTEDNDRSLRQPFRDSSGRSIPRGRPRASNSLTQQRSCNLSLVPMRFIDDLATGVILICPFILSRDVLTTAHLCIKMIKVSSEQDQKHGQDRGGSLSGRCCQYRPRARRVVPVPDDRRG